MRTPIENLDHLISSHLWWFAKVRSEGFGIILPNGWLGQPFDNQHSVNKIEVKGSELHIVFDDIRELRIVDPKSYDVQALDGSMSSFKFFECSEISLLWVPYGEEKTAPKVTQKFDSPNENTIELVGYFSI